MKMPVLLSHQLTHAVDRYLNKGPKGHKKSKYKWSIVEYNWSAPQSVNPKPKPSNSQVLCHTTVYTAI